MERRGRWVAVSALAAAALVVACSTKVCTERGCQDQLRATIKNADGSVPPGAHLVEVTADGATLSCTVQVPAGGGTAVAQCPVGLDVEIGQESECTDTATGSARVLECRPIAGRFFEAIMIAGKPSQLHVRVTVDGAVVLDRTENPTYAMAYPNGPECEPVCQQASLEWMFAAP